jgi:hypothetical protein
MNKEAIKKRIRALREMTTARGCTEAEAMAAAAKLSELMSQYEIDESSVEIEMDNSSVSGGPYSQRSSLWAMIGWATNTAPLFSDMKGSKNKIEFFGKAPGPEVAAYLAQVLDRALNRELSEFKLGKFYRGRRSLKTRRQASNDFTIGMVNRLRRKIHSLFEHVHDESSYQLSAQERDKLYTDTKETFLPVKKTRFDDAVYAGICAGEAVELSHGVDGSAKPLAIGGDT